MKKAYLKPEVSVSNIQPVSVIASSIGFSSDPADNLYPGGGDAPEFREWFE